MADIKISALGAASALGGTEEVPIVQGGVTVKTTTAAIAALAPAILMESGAGEKISAMTAAGALTGTEEVPIVQGGANVITTLSAIKTFVGSGGARTVTQTATHVGAAVDTVTFANAPANGALLVAFCCGASASPNSGWINVLQDSGGDTETFMFVKLCGAGETAAQTFMNPARNAALAMFELSPGSTPSTWFGSSDGGGSSRNINVTAASIAGLIIGIVMSESTILYPNLVPGTQGAQGNDVTANKSITTWYETPAVGVNNLTATFALTNDFRFNGEYIG